MSMSSPLVKLSVGRESPERFNTAAAVSESKPPHLQKVANGSRKQATALDHRIESLMILAEVTLQEVKLLKEQPAVEESVDLDLQTQVRRFEAELIRSALHRTGGCQRRAARLLGVKVTTLNSKIKRYRIPANSVRVLTDQNA
jgi:DNA-binding NtrC family response regulator